MNSIKKNVIEDLWLLADFTKDEAEDEFSRLYGKTELEYLKTSRVGSTKRLSRKDRKKVYEIYEYHVMAAGARS